MKKLFSLVILFSFFALPSAVKAQRVTLKANVLSPIVKTGSYFGEVAFSPNLSAQLGYFNTGIKIGDTSFDGFGVTPELRYFFTGNAPTGFYGAGYARYQNFDLTQEEKQAKGKFSSFGGGALVGYQFLLGQFLVVDAFAGPGFNAVTVNGGNSAQDFDLGTFSGFSPRAGLSVGIAF